MKKTIATWTIATAAMMGLAACSSEPAPESSASAGSSAESTPESTPEAEAPASDQSVAEACTVVQTNVQDAGDAVSQLDMSTATSDPQATIETITAAANSIGAAADSVGNVDVKSSVDAVHDDLVTLGDLLSTVLVDRDLTAVGDLSTAVTDVQTSAQELATLCN